MGLRASEILIATSLGLGYVGATATLAGAEEVAVVGDATAECLNVVSDSLVELPSTDLVAHCSLADTAQEISHNPADIVEPFLVGCVAVAAAAAITGTKKRTEAKVNSFRWSPSAIRRRI